MMAGDNSIVRGCGNGGSQRQHVLVLDMGAGCYRLDSLAWLQTQPMYNAVVVIVQACPREVLMVDEVSELALSLS